MAEKRGSVDSGTVKHKRRSSAKEVHGKRGSTPSIVSAGQRKSGVSSALADDDCADLEPPPPTCMQKFKAYLAKENKKLFIQRTYFTGFIYSAIVLNAIQMGFQVDHKEEPWKSVWVVTETIFMVIFLIEMVIKMIFLRGMYFIHSESFDDNGKFVKLRLDMWNWLDCFICGTAVISWTFTMIEQSQGTEGKNGGSSMLKVFQFLRLLRMVKLLKMKKELITLVEGIVGSLKSMCWIAMLLLVIVYGFSIFYARVVGGFDYPGTYMNEQFGTLPQTMLSLFNVAILDTWGSYVRPFFEHQIYMVAVSLIFVVLTAFSIMNAIVGIVVEKTTAAATAMAEQEILEKKLKQHQMAEDVVAKLNEIDQNGDGTIDYDELVSWESMLAENDNPQATDMLESIELPNHFKMGDLHRMLDANGDGCVNAPAFLQGLDRIIDVNGFFDLCNNQLGMGYIKRRLHRVKKAMDTCNRDADEILAEFAALRNHLELMPVNVQEEEEVEEDVVARFEKTVGERGVDEGEVTFNRSKTKSFNEAGEVLAPPPEPIGSEKEPFACLQEDPVEAEPFNGDLVDENTSGGNTRSSMDSISLDEPSANQNDEEFTRSSVVSSSDTPAPTKKKKKKHVHKSVEHIPLTSEGARESTSQEE